MRTTTLGGSTVEVTQLALGCAAMGNLYHPVTDEVALATVEAAWDAGIRTFDTAPHYGLGLAEKRLGAALRGRPRDTYTVSTKVGRLLAPNPESGFGDDLAHGFAVPATHRRVWDFTADGVLRSLEASLERLGLDRVDIALLHDPDNHAEQALREAYPALERLRAEGVIGAIGVGMNQSALPARFLRETDIDVVLLAGRYTLLDHDGLAEVLPEAAARGQSVVIGGVFNSGLLTNPRPGATYDYAPAPQPVLDRALRLLAVTERHGVPLRAAALRFPFGHPAVASVLTGARTPEEVRDTVEQLRRTIPDAVWEDLRAEELLANGTPVPVATPSKEPS
ncbi:aldo/keto reductase [Streptomyces sp. CA-210063]|uniref:aldo/keto reductase n=1 Tax=Streptomyces sp. CA-210063 TaxID=2801029 RepID=UPI00214C9FA7|nr:aldo/keto reductase [Streptomyces sp. CA-210063]UUU29389.1 aldo/keto reductase [Streptomyces sp. CA-210063]